ncbi:hypothetical protein OH817_10745 [Kocuria rhizophila]|uniref:DUF4097 family beta strand repeat-containing protein n=1 Tax=Kocuria rhizophila TaxID=72000 RepID=UPI002ED27331|nr:hypothetical protein OH817_10745 [Kocuria rhizophila]
MSTQFPDPSSSSPSTTPPASLPGDGRPPRESREPRIHDRPVSRGERRAWNTATAVLGGVVALGLLLGGAGTAAALALTQERDGSWTADAVVSTIRVDAPTASVDVSTSPTVDHVQVQWHETGLRLDARQPEPTLDKGTLRVEYPSPQSGWNSSARTLSVVVPQGDPAVSLDLTASRDTVNIQGAYQNVTATTEVGSIRAQDVEATVLNARATTGDVLLDGVRVSNRLDAHVSQGMAMVNVHGAAPRRTSVTATTGGYGAALPAADYWYPAGSQKDFPDPHHPRTVNPWPEGDPESPSSSNSGTSEDTASGDGVFPLTAATADTHQTVPAAVRSEAGTSSSLDADTVCASAPRGRPCLFLKGTPVDVRDSGTVDSWNGDWQEPAENSPGSLRSSDSPRSSGSPTPAVTTAPAREQ